MAQDPALAFGSNLVDRFIQMKGMQIQLEFAKRRDERYDRQLQQQASQFAQRERRYEEDPRRKLAQMEYDILSTLPQELQARAISKGTTVVMPGEAQKSTIGKLEDDIREINEGLYGLETVRNLYKPEYSTYEFKAKKFLATTGEKFGIEAPKAETSLRVSKEQIAEYSAWFGTAEQQFLVFRKWATGVAGGPMEMQAIRTAFPDPKDKSPTEFAAMLDQAIRFKETYRAELAQQVLGGTVITPEIKSRILMDTLKRLQSEQTVFKEEATEEYHEGQIAENPQTGEKLIFRNGRWEPLNKSLFLQGTREAQPENPFR